MQVVFLKIIIHSSCDERKKGTDRCVLKLLSCEIEQVQDANWSEAILCKLQLKWLFQIDLANLKLKMF